VLEELEGQNMDQVPKLIVGARHEDQRGSLLFNNELNILNFRRMYIINNSDSQLFRGWHGHELESKIFITLSGRIRFGAVRVKDWSTPDKSEVPQVAELKADSLDAFFVPGGYANGILSLEPGSQALVISSSTLSDSLVDDYRIESTFWEI
jgi:dTDP-4-dehydrorhamnose 3,5-epimerase-like enzyme